MADQYKGPFADFTAFVADANAINAATKTALNTALTNIGALVNPVTGTSAPHTDFEKCSPALAAALLVEINALKAAVTAHA